MERSFSEFGRTNLRRQFRFDSALGLDDQQVQLDELEDIELFMPDMQLEMIQPSPGDVISLRTCMGMSQKDLPLGFFLYSKLNVDDDFHEVVYEIYLPENYPSIDEPTIKFKCDSLEEDIIYRLNFSLDNHIREHSSANGLILDCIEWIQRQVMYALQHRDKPYSEIEFVPWLKR